MPIPHEDHLRIVYDCLLPGNPYTAAVDEEECCKHGIPFEEEEEEEGNDADSEIH